jgi:transcriptional regulator with XRE-family HTH domain
MPELPILSKDWLLSRAGFASRGRIMYASGVGSMTPESEHMIKVLKTAMRVLGYKYQDVEKKLGVAPGYMGRLFRGVIQLRFDHIVEITQAIGLKPEEIFQLAFPQPPQPPSEGAQRLRQMAHSLPGTSGLSPEPTEASPSAAASDLSIEEETERIERIVLRTFEKFFSSMAKNAAGRD